MRPHPHRTLALGGVAVVLALAALTMFWWRWERGVLYRGKTVPEWSSLIFAPEPQASNAIAALHAMGPEAIPDLVRLLKAGDPFLQKTARSLFRQLPTPMAWLVSPYVNRVPATWIRRSAARSLGVIGPAARVAVPELLQALRHPDQGLAWEAATTLGRMGRVSLPGLLEAASAPDPTTRRVAIFALGQLPPENQESMAALVRALHDPEAAIRASAAYSLSTIGLPAIAPLVEELGRERGGLRETAGALVLRIYNFRPVPGADAAMAGNDPNREARRLALGALAQSGTADDLVQQVFSGALRDPASEVRLIGLQHLNLQGTNTMPVLVGLVLCLKDDSAAVRAFAAEALGSIGLVAKPATASLTRLLEDDNETVRVAAREALNKLQTL
ncbi:MAG TPA: HEAT repeat domain-containing protein [Candidatus Acidoferrum sp.]|nr:HEAT repeat domain-containing protein [Candidatus Acidoferrum sp.]